MPRYKITVAYDGTNFHGWQKQKRAEPFEPDGDSEQCGNGTSDPGVSSDDEAPDAPPLRTVQGVLEHAVRTVVREPVNRPFGLVADYLHGEHQFERNR